MIPSARTHIDPEPEPDSPANQSLHYTTAHYASHQNVKTQPRCNLPTQHLSLPGILPLAKSHFDGSLACAISPTSPR